MRDPQEPLEEKDFIRESTLSPTPFWIWFALFLLFVGLVWFAERSFHAVVGKEEGIEKAFYEVTERDFSVFLWQNPGLREEYSHLVPSFFASEKRPGSQIAGQIVLAPPALLFLYHTWHRLLAPYQFRRPIPADDFAAFLEEVPIWQPKYWPKAPQPYQTLVASLDEMGEVDLSPFPLATLPHEVRSAFIGWLNAAKEGQLIREFRPSAGVVRSFLEKYPHYGRSYWKNIEDSPERKYLFSLSEMPENEPVGNDRMTPFLRQAVYNYTQAT